MPCGFRKGVCIPTFNIRQPTSEHVSIRQHTSGMYTMYTWRLHTRWRLHTGKELLLRLHRLLHIELLLRLHRQQLLRCQYLYFCISKASKLSTHHHNAALCQVRRYRSGDALQVL